jgi:hypothetical protein
MRRSIEDTATSRFVTGGRVEALLKVCPSDIVYHSFID